MRQDVINGELLSGDDVMESVVGRIVFPENSSILSALNNFYAAFNQRDVDKSISNWAQQDDVVMCNPMGGIRRGIESIRDGYQFIMDGDTHVYVEFYDYELIESTEISYVTGRERGFARRSERQLDLDIRTSRIYKKINGQWRQMHHHGSMTNVKALQQYQDFLKATA